MVRLAAPPRLRGQEERLDVIRELVEVNVLGHGLQTVQQLGARPFVRLWPSIVAGERGTEAFA